VTARSQPTGWFADLADEDERDERWPWQVFLQLETECHAMAGVWFATKEQCENFIRTKVVGQGLLPD
jgi:hypothetical protein